jgi:hypothetical protein
VGGAGVGTPGSGVGGGVVHVSPPELGSQTFVPVFGPLTQLHPSQQLEAAVMLHPPQADVHPCA